MNLTLEQHIALAAELRRFRKAMSQPHIMHIGRANSKERRASDALLRKLDSLRNHMDSALFRDHSGALPARELCSVYYGPGE